MYSKERNRVIRFMNTMEIVDGRLTKATKKKIDVCYLSPSFQPPTQPTIQVSQPTIGYISNPVYLPTKCVLVIASHRLPDLVFSVDDCSPECCSLFLPPFLSCSVGDAGPAAPCSQVTPDVPAVVTRANAADMRVHFKMDGSV